MKKFNKILSTILVFALAFTFTACNKDKKPIIPTPDPDGDKIDINRGYEYKKQSENLFQFYSSDTNLDEFINEYMERHLRYSNKAIGELKLGQGNSIWKEWESMAVMYMNTSSLGYDPKETIKSWANNITQDEFGYIWMDNGTDSSAWGQSWEFPNSNHSKDKAGVYHNHTYDFKGSDEGWTATADNGTGKVTSGFYSVTGNDMTKVTFETKTLNTFMADSFYSPFVEIRFNINDLDSIVSDQISDIKMFWKTTGDANYSAEKMVSYSTFASTKYDKFPSTAKVVFPMYAHPEWKDNKRVEDMKIEVEFKNGFNGELALDQVDLSFDARQINNNGIFITAVANYFEYTQDIDFLKKNIGKLRKAMQFYLTYCEGEKGLVTTKNFTGHDGGTNADYFSATMDNPTQGLGKGIGDGYWDCLSYPQKSSYCNNLYYLSLQKMKYLEDMVTESGIEASAEVSVKTPDMKGRVKYDKTSESLNQLLDMTKTEYNKAFWDESLGRYNLGINDEGDVVDYGFTLYNQEAIMYGLADGAKAVKIQEWINGDRKIATDDAKGKNIYFYEFAPRWTTKNNKNQFWWRFNGATGANYKWLYQVQNGGTTAHQAYYDLGATADVNGVETAFTKLKRIQKWYENVKAEGGTGTNFYSDFYSKYSDSVYKLQGKEGAGAIGLDSEFLEAAILYSAVPDTFFRLGSSEYKTLDIEPKLPNDLKFWKMENLTYMNLIYDLSIGKNFVQINSVNGKIDNQKIKVTLDKPEKNFEVRQHNRILKENTDYIIVNNKVIITVPFQNGRIQIIEK